jgi:ribosome-interacting GTPase 1
MVNIRMLARVVLLGCAVAYGIVMWQARTADAALGGQITAEQKNEAALSEEIRQACERAGVTIDDKSPNVVCEDNRLNGVKVD